MLVVVMHGAAACRTWERASQPSPVPPRLSTAAITRRPNNDVSETFYQQGLSRAASARSIAASAVSSEDWELVRQQWQEAIAALQTIPEDHPRYTSVIALIPTYRQELGRIPSQPVTPAERMTERTSVQVATMALARSENLTSGSGSPTPATVIMAGKMAGTTLTYEKSNVSDPPTFQINIKRWVEDRPLINVTINQNLQFEMIVDPKVNNTQITATAAQLLSLPITQQVIISPATSTFAQQGKVASVQLGAVTLNNVLVTVGDDTLQLGVLGNDVLNNFQVSLNEESLTLGLSGDF